MNLLTTTKKGHCPKGAKYTKPYKACIPHLQRTSMDSNTESLSGTLLGSLLGTLLGILLGTLLGNLWALAMIQKQLAQVCPYASCWGGRISSKSVCDTLPHVYRRIRGFYGRY